jgi:aspartyl/glutamyl-tRNA(Asn/Gln) amidotransferase C subunit
MQLADIKKLAEMARIDMTEEEMSGMAHDFEAILAYVSQVQEVSKLLKKDINDDQKIDHGPLLKNIMREDISTNKSGEYADKIIKEMPDKDGRYLKVKQIL